jgi:hypothetical protein
MDRSMVVAVSTLACSRDEFLKTGLFRLHPVQAGRKRAEGMAALL